MLFSSLLESVDDPSMLVLGVLGGTVMLVAVVVVAFLIKTRQVKLNWYEQNVLEMAHTPERRRCKSFNRADTDDDARSLQGVHADLCRKQSRIVEVKDHHLALPKHDISGSFHIPKAQKTNRSMFTNPQQSQFDRGMYQCTVPDESACSEEMGNAGSLHLGLSLDPNLNLLTVYIKQAIDLPSKRQDDHPNPYFRVCLDVPDNIPNKSEQQTKTYKGSASPTIGEEFYFQMPPAAQLANCRLEIMVYDFDQFSVDECVGYCWLTLGRLSVSTQKENPTVFWAEVLPYDENQGKGFGEVLFSLAYLSHAQRLTMNVFKARNLPCKSEQGGAISIRVSLMSGVDKRLKRKKTGSKRNVKNAQFNESLTFGVPKHTLCDVLLEIEAVHETGTFGMTSEVVGRMELPLHKCKDLWRAIIREEKSQARWYSLEEP